MTSIPSTRTSSPRSAAPAGLGALRRGILRSIHGVSSLEARDVDHRLRTRRGRHRRRSCRGRARRQHQQQAGRRAVDGSVYHLVTNPPKVDKLCDLDGTPLVQREDDSEETVLRRLEVYGQRTKPLYDLYREKGILDEVDAIGSAEEVYDRLLKVVEGKS